MNSSFVKIDGQGHGTHVSPNLVLVARRDEPSPSAATDLSNVVPFVRRRAVGVAFPLASIAATDRPARSAPDLGGAWRIALLVGSLALHSLVLLMFRQDVRPAASIGVESMTVEITLGSSHAAGVASQSGEQEVEPATSPEATSQNTETPEQQPPVAEVPAPKVQQEDERTRTDAPPVEKNAQKQQVAAAPADSASGVGRGRSDANSTYGGLVAAHLQRYKQYPAAARKARARGVATVSFTVDETGRVTSVELAQTSGVSAFDQEVVAMVRRASPFPRPPDRRSRDFTVPVRFN
ncbi:MAG: energy transducer TonB [Xanthobacteraceae bacterium]|nr:energy transducer TonB [Xanthobacteraceae bacterium]